MSKYQPDDVSNHPDGYESDYGTMPDNIAELERNIVGHKIVSIDDGLMDGAWPGYPQMIITLDNGKRVALSDSSDCCAFTELTNFLAHPENFDHAITAVESENGYTKWHILADMRELLELDVSWSSGTGYYSYGFWIKVYNPKKGTWEDVSDF